MKNADRTLPPCVDEAFGGACVTCHLSQSHQAWCKFFMQDIDWETLSGGEGAPGIAGLSHVPGFTGIPGVQRRSSHLTYMQQRCPLQLHASKPMQINYMFILSVAPNLWTAIQASHVARNQQFRASMMLALRLQQTLQLALRECLLSLVAQVSQASHESPASPASQVPLALKVLQVRQDGCGGIAGARLLATNRGHFLCQSSVVPSELADSVSNVEGGSLCSSPDSRPEPPDRPRPGDPRQQLCNGCFQGDAAG